MFTDSVIEGLKTGETTYDLTMAMNGALGGLVAVTAGCSVVTPWAAIVIGVVGGLVYVGFSKLLVALCIDDAVDAIPVHFANGFWGVLAVGLLAEPDLMSIAGYNSDNAGWFYSFDDGSDMNLLLAQVVSLVWILGWVTVTMLPFFVLLKKFNMFRVDPMEEEVGLDISHHRGPAYDFSGAPKQADIDELIHVRASRHGNVELPSAAAQAAGAAEVGTEGK